MSLDRKRKEVEILRIQASRAELEMKILEREEEIERIRVSMAAQDKRIAELKSELGVSDNG